MALVNLVINGKIYGIGCEDGAEKQLELLGAMVDARAREIAGQGGQGETRLMLLVALTLADELENARVLARDAQAQTAGGDKALTALEEKAARVIEAAAKRIEALAAETAVPVGV
ncbi:MAG TPA: cell division protein ZapA [Caulobacteraceae bacterium]|jgi:cell division protein ZapA|nr:cell division protein ZapA [Caulobacteraceae bacterium]